MKETITINIKGFNFHIDVDAYEKLKSYLVTVNDRFRNHEGGQEIISDIESRIAELFHERLKNNEPVVNLLMVTEVIEIMGMPENFADDGNQQYARQANSANFKKQSRRLFRDPESRVVGGVCSGLAYYFNLDKQLVRILFVVLFVLTSGVALPVYIILWIAVPKATTTSQRLEMKGEPITIENIGKSVTEEFNEMKDNFDHFKTSKEYQKGKEYAKNTAHSAAEGGKTAISVLLKILGAFFVFLGFVTLVGLSFALVAATRMVGFLPEFNFGMFLNHIFSDQFTTAIIISSVLIVGIPLLLLIYAGTKMIFNYTSNNRSVIMSALGAWLVGILIAIVSFANAIDAFSSSSSYVENYSINVPSDTIFLKIDKTKENDFDESKFEFDKLKVVELKGKEVLVARPTFTIDKNFDESVSLRVDKKSRGNNIRSAKDNASEIEYGYRTEGSTVFFDPYYLLGDNNKWRNQKVDMVFRIPVGKTVFIDGSILPIIFDVKNTSNVWDGDMVNAYWTMKPEGLTFGNYEFKK